MDDCVNCEFLEKCREGVRVPCPWETVEIVHNPLLRELWIKNYMQSTGSDWGRAARAYTAKGYI